MTTVSYYKIQLIIKHNSVVGFSVVAQRKTKTAIKIIDQICKQWKILELVGSFFLVKVKHENLFNSCWLD